MPSAFRFSRWVGFGAGGLLLVVTGFLASGKWPVARFRAEEIHVDLRPGGYDVDGRYWYHNPLPVPWVQGLVVPTASGKGLAGPATVSVDVEGREIPVFWADWPRFQVRIPARGEVEVRVRFHQEAVSRGVYLLTTTRRWGRPIEEARFFLHSTCVFPVSSSLPLQDVMSQTGYQIRDFLPGSDWSFSWEPAPCDG